MSFNWRRRRTSPATPCASARAVRGVRARAVAIGLVGALGVALAMRAGAGDVVLARAADLAELSLEQLSNVVVTSVARRPESLASAAASVYVITAEEIRRSGATSLPEVLRLAPNLDVARVDTNQYAISARGFNNVLANKLLVLVDGRTVYTPLFSGVFWEAQDVLLADVDRIEVISGPGGTLWGANAVNGVINVITRSAADTPGTLAWVGGGNLESGAAARRGGRLGDDGRYRLYAKYARRDHSELPDGTAVRDASDRVQAGFRADIGTPQGALTMQGDAYWGDLDQAPGGRRIHGGNLLARFSRAFDDGGMLRVQAYYDHTYRNHAEQFRKRLDTVDVEAQYGQRVQERHQVLVGGGYRDSRDRVGNSATQAFLPANRTLAWSNVFVQDEIELADAVTLTLGAKAERNDYTGTEFLPGARLAWRVRPDFFTWAAVSRVVRAPSRIDREIYVPGVPPYLLVGNDTFISEVATVYEAGVRGQPSAAISYAVTVFDEPFDRLRSLAPTPAGLVFANDGVGRHRGVEAWGSWRVAPWWRLLGGITALRETRGAKGGRVDLSSPDSLGNDPSAWWSLRSYFDIAPQHEVDVALRHTNARGASSPAVPAYTALDVRYAWHPSRALEISLTGQNLADARHAEWQNRAEIGRGLFLRVTWTP
jgi:iron complex outermembrane receptor protein